MNSSFENTQVLEEVYLGGDQYFASLCRHISQARSKIIFETYIFHKDNIGDKVIKELISARQRGVDVRIMVDAIGSPDFAKEYGSQLKVEKIKFVIYRPLPWQDPGTETIKRGRYSIIEKFSRLHRKVCVIDEYTAFLGSMNITADHASEKNHGKGWNDVSIKICSSCSAKQLTDAFNLAWENRTVAVYPHKRSNVRLNYCPSERRSLNANFFKRIASASNRVWIVTGYMSLNRECLKALQKAVDRGADVCIILSRDCDVKSSRWVSYYKDYSPLLKIGVKIFEYLPHILHAKCCIIDDFFMIGSSNLNGRSRDTDLEADVVLSTANSKTQLEEYFEENIKNCLHIKSCKDIRKMPVYELFLSVFAGEFSALLTSHI